MLLMLMALAMAAQPVWAQHQFGERRKSYGYGVDRNAVYFEGRVIPMRATAGRFTIVAKCCKVLIRARFVWWAMPKNSPQW